MKEEGETGVFRGHVLDRIPELQIKVAGPGGKVDVGFESLAKEELGCD